MDQKQLATDLDKAFGDLVAEFRDGLYSGVRRLVPQSVDAEDICAEAFLRAYRALADMALADIRRLDLGPWMWTIALNLSRNAARRRARKPWVRLDPAWSAAAAEGGPESLVLDRSHVETLLEELPHGQRAAVVLRYIVGLSYPEIATATGRPEGSIKADVHRGLERLRRSEAS
ncbi:MAG: RNA polymerase sigma factor [Acidimicrobiia bacterium]|nr:RNA polymerase sigma factor [Acidimicrobiia bacterium]